MSNRSKARGTAFESKIVEALHDAGFPAVERRTLAGINDRGDIAGLAGIVIEAKAEKSPDFSGYIREAERERDNAGAWLGVAWSKTVGRGSALDGKVTLSGRQFVALLVVLREAGLLEHPPLVCFNHDGIPTGTV